eukprot:TRINITY_DN1519_c0_g3_i1.p1 TRINITY_DN1519_c0_g3~~TRINITY_DN1519_c0_g3_i1.p1  ORF type:complete len:400 (-),score=110.76 TRINITY_DN1519_c0_g3_i1:153-1352(-)
MSHSVISLSVNQEVCEDQAMIKWSRHLWIHIVVFILAAVSLWLTVHGMYNRHYSYLKFHERYVRPHTAIGSDSPLKDAMELVDVKNTTYRERVADREFSEDNKRLLESSIIYVSRSVFKGIQFRDDRVKKVMAQKAPKSWFSYWNLLVLIATVFQICSVLLFIFDHRKRISAACMLMGFGSFFSWVSILRYFQYDANYFFMFNAILTSSPTIIRYLLGAVLIFFGYGFFASSVFWRSHRYESTTRTMQIQFALLDGDSIYDTFADLTRYHFGLGQLYLYTYIIMFICVVQNLFVSIIQKVYSDYRKEETRSIIEKEKAVLIEENKKKKEEREAKLNASLVLKAQMEEVMDQLNAVKTQFEVQTKDIPPSDKEEITKEYENGISMLTAKLAELEKAYKQA